MVEDAYSGVQKLKQTYMFNSLTDEQKQVAVAFSMWYELEDKQMYKEISVENVNKNIPEWTKE